MVERLAGVSGVWAGGDYLASGRCKGNRAGIIEAPWAACCLRELDGLGRAL